MPTYELYRKDDQNGAVDHSIFPSTRNHVAIHVARAMAPVGGQVEVWSDGVKIAVLRDTVRQADQDYFVYRSEHYFIHHLTPLSSRR